MGGGYVFVNHASVQSYDIGENVCSTLPDIIYRSEKRARRRPGKWMRIPGTGGLRRKLPVPWELRYVATRTELLNVVAAGRYTSRAKRHVSGHIAYRDGDAETRSALEAKWAKEREASAAEGKRLADLVMGRATADSKRFDANDVTGKETLIPPTDLTRLADKARALINTNDPDAVRAGLAETANALDAISQPEPQAKAA
jgi:hypothetical protein